MSSEQIPQAPTEPMLVPYTGELIEPRDTERVMEALLFLREFKRDQLDPFIAELERAVLTYGMDVQAAYTLRLGGLVASSVSEAAAKTYQYDGERLRKRLREAGLPADQVEEAVAPVVSYKVNAARLKMLAQHAVYGPIVEECRTEVPKRRSVSVKRDG